MSQVESSNSYILISNNIEEEFLKIKEQFKENRVVGFIEDDFKIENAKAVIDEAYISDSQLKYLVLGANSFNTISQNSLLKILEEPPKNIAFIIISPTKSNLLQTVRSRLPIKIGSTTVDKIVFNISLSKVDYKDIFSFLKENSRVKKSTAKNLVEAIYRRATLEDMLILTTQQLEIFDKAYRLLELNSRPQTVLAMILMSFVNER